MDVSRQTNGGGDETTSMYLSFDAESTMSSAAFKTLEASTISSMDVGEEALEDSREQHMHSTLELEGCFGDGSHPTVRKMDAATEPMPLRAFPKKILQEYKALSSTPTKEQLMRSVEIARGSDLGLAFLGMEDDNKHTTSFAPLPEENKENALPENSEASTLSEISSSMEVEKASTVIERKLLATQSSIEEESLENLSQEATQKDAEGTPKVDTDVHTEIIRIELKEKANKHKSKLLAPKNVRKTICEPNLHTNRPSRIMTNTKTRQSLASFGFKPSSDKDITSDIPKLLDKMLKISNEAKEEAISNIAATKATHPDKRKSMAGGAKSRSSLMPKAQAEKRPFSFTQRMSIMVKTTLNSPARKIARRSVLSVNQQTRSSLLLAKTDGPSGTASTRSMLPVGRTTKSSIASTRTSILKTLKEGESPLTPTKKTNRKSLYPQPKLANPKNSEATGAKPKSTDTNYVFVCSICSLKFRIKSLLDAHKRSHEDDTRIPTFVKKPTSTAAVPSNSDNKCKYCDKKFALQRTLHIHLLQNCSKIPPNDKRKLHYTEMNHVEKAQLPHVFASGSNNPQANSLPNAGAPKMPQKSHSNLSSGAAMSSSESLIESKEVTIIAKQLVDEVQSERSQMSAPSVTKIRKITAHSGVYRTPNKSVPCYICKQSFKSILDYTQHNMTMHSSTQQRAANEGDNTEHVDDNSIISKN